ncbi:hypothetical protein J6590_009486 [Homalodisca vitripennis]|nr:hypothetical protein J6590_009486 [Homalodisca vitripennis]
MELTKFEQSFVSLTLACLYSMYLCIVLQYVPIAQHTCGDVIVPGDSQMGQSRDPTTWPRLDVTDATVDPRAT